MALPYAPTYMNSFVTIACLGRVLQKSLIETSIPIKPAATGFVRIGLLWEFYARTI